MPFGWTEMPSTDFLYVLYLRAGFCIKLHCVNNRKTDTLCKTHTVSCTQSASSAHSHVNGFDHCILHSQLISRHYILYTTQHIPHLDETTRWKLLKGAIRRTRRGRLTAKNSTTVFSSKDFPKNLKEWEVYSCCSSTLDCVISVLYASVLANVTTWLLKATFSLSYLLSCVLWKTDSLH